MLTNIVTFENNNLTAYYRLFDGKITIKFKKGCDKKVKQMWKLLHKKVKKVAKNS